MSHGKFGPTLKHISVTTYYPYLIWWAFLLIASLGVSDYRYIARCFYKRHVTLIFSVSAFSFLPLLSNKPPCFSKKSHVMSSPQKLYITIKYNEKPEPSLGPRQFHVGSQTQDECYTSDLTPEVDVTRGTFLSNPHCRKQPSKNNHTKANIPKPYRFCGRRWKTLWKTWTPLERFPGRRKSVNKTIYIYVLFIIMNLRLPS